MAADEQHSVTRAVVDLLTKSVLARFRTARYLGAELFLLFSRRERDDGVRREAFATWLGFSFPRAGGRATLNSAPYSCTGREACSLPQDFSLWNT